MLSESDKLTVSRHIWGFPICEVKKGIHEHLRYTGMKDLQLLCRALNCGIHNLIDRMWEERRARRWRQSCSKKGSMDAQKKKKEIGTGKVDQAG